MDDQRLEAIDAYFRAANYLTVGQIYLRENPLLREPLKPEHIKARLLGHWGTSPGLNLIYAHLNRLIQDTEAKFLYVTGPGHGGPALRANVFLEGVMTKVYPEITMNTYGIDILMREFSWPGGVPSHVSPPTPGSIHEGGELGYALVHAYGAAFDNPDLIVACVVGDGEAETGPLAASWHSNKFLNPNRDGAVLPIFHLNGYKISGPTIFGRMEKPQLEDFFRGCNYEPRIVEGDDPMDVHRQMWEALDWAYEKIRALQAKELGDEIPNWPMIILETPKGWTGPKVVDGKKVEGTFRSHQVPLSGVVTNPDHLHILDEWMRSYGIEELFDDLGRPVEKVLSCVPKEELRMGASPHANGGLLMKELKTPDFRDYAVDVPSPGSVIGETTREFGKYLRDLMKANPDNFRLFCPDETSSNRLNNVFEVTGRMYLGKIHDWDEDLSHDGRVLEVLSEHLCQGWLEGYNLTGRYGIFPCYEAFAMIVDSMVNQHGKWLKACEDLPWRKPIPSLNYLLTSHAWRQDHNGYSHQGPGFIESMLQKKADVARIYLPPDVNCLLKIGDHCMESKNFINLIIAGKQPMPQWLSMKEAEQHCLKGISTWKWACNDNGIPDIVMASAGDVPTLETLAAITILNDQFPTLKIRMINVIDLFTLAPDQEHSHGLKDADFEKLFTKTTPVIFAFHGHPHVVHELLYKRGLSDRLHVHGYLEEGTTTTPFDMVVCNKMSRFHLAMNALSRVPHMESQAKKFTEECREKLKLHKAYIQEHGEDMPEIRNWKWGNGRVRKTA